MKKTREKLEKRIIETYSGLRREYPDHKYLNYAIVKSDKLTLTNHFKFRYGCIKGETNQLKEYLEDLELESTLGAIYSGTPKIHPPPGMIGPN
jgi:hypothetical protein